MEKYGADRQYFYFYPVPLQEVCFAIFAALDLFCLVLSLVAVRYSNCGVGIQHHVLRLVGLIVIYLGQFTDRSHEKRYPP